MSTEDYYESLDRSPEADSSLSNDMDELDNSNAPKGVRHSMEVMPKTQT